MTVKKLKKLLESVDENRIVIMSKDAEGNAYSPLEALDNDAIYKADSTYSGDVSIEKLTPSSKKQGWTKEDIILEGKPALVLWPIN